MMIPIAAMLMAVSEALAAEPELRPGLASVLFHDVDMTRPAEFVIDSQIDLDLGTSYNDCAKRWWGLVRAPVAGDVRFNAEADNGVRLWIDGIPVIDGWAEDGARDGIFHFERAGQFVRVLLEFYQSGGEARLRLDWSWPGRDRELIPPEAWRHTSADLDRARKTAEGRSSAEHVPVSLDNARIYEPGKRVQSEESISLGLGPHLFVDDYLIASSEGVRRVVNVPERDATIPNPIVTGKEDGCFQPYMSIVRDPVTGQFRMWYGCYTREKDTARSRIGYLESDDGVHWQRPHRVLEDPAPIQFGVSVFDEGPTFPRPGKRYKYGWWKDGGLKVATSPDGLMWTPMTPSPVILHNHDINSVWRDPLRNRYVATLSVYVGSDFWEGSRRVTMQGYSEDLLTWTEPHHVLVPQSKYDDGETQFYAMDGYLARGDLIIGMVKVLRDDLKADDPPDPPEAYGIGYTTLAWTRDGETWYRDTTPFFRPHPKPGLWDHAHAWIDEQLPVGDEVFLYYGGYARGHKVARFEERQIGLITMRRDRYVARESEAGILVTPPLKLDASRLTLNVNATGGSVAVDVLTDEQGTVHLGFAARSGTVQDVDGLDVPVQWPDSLAQLNGQVVRLRFTLNRARLFGFSLE